MSQVSKKQSEPAPAGQREEAQDSAGTGRDDPWKIRGVAERIEWARRIAHLLEIASDPSDPIPIQLADDTQSGIASALKELADRLEREAAPPPAPCR